jgi:hypothetical protein
MRRSLSVVWRYEECITNWYTDTDACKIMLNSLEIFFLVTDWRDKLSESMFLSNFMFVINILYVVANQSINEKSNICYYETSVYKNVKEMSVINDSWCFSGW